MMKQQRREKGGVDRHQPDAARRARRAAVVIVNPTHFCVAAEMGSSSARTQPDLRRQGCPIWSRPRIREIAQETPCRSISDPPTARALFVMPRSRIGGKEIRPDHLRRGRRGDRFARLCFAGQGAARHERGSAAVLRAAWFPPPRDGPGSAAGQARTWHSTGGKSMVLGALQGRPGRARCEARRGAGRRSGLSRRLPTCSLERLGDRASASRSTVSSPKRVLPVKRALKAELRVSLGKLEAARRARRRSSGPTAIRKAGVARRDQTSWRTISTIRTSVIGPPTLSNAV